MPHIWKHQFSVFFRGLKSQHHKRSICVNVCKLKREKKAFEIAKANFRCFHWFPAAILEPLRGTPSWRVHTKLCNFEWYILPNNSSTGYRTALRLQGFVYLLLFYNISISWLNLLNDLTCMTCTWLKTKNYCFPIVGQVLPYENIRDIIKFCKEEKLVLLADEVCNII